jgi:hypothetical protein
LFEKSPSDAHSLVVGMNDEPSEPGSLPEWPSRIDGYGADEILVRTGRQKEVAALPETGHELGKLSPDLGLEGDIETPVLMVVDGMELYDLPDHAWKVASKIYPLMGARGHRLRDLLQENEMSPAIVIE